MPKIFVNRFVSKVKLGIIKVSLFNKLLHKECAKTEQTKICNKFHFQNRPAEKTVLLAEVKSSPQQVNIKSQKMIRTNKLRTNKQIKAKKIIIFALLDWPIGYNIVPSNGKRSCSRLGECVVNGFTSVCDAKVET